VLKGIWNSLPQNVPEPLVLTRPRGGWTGYPVGGGTLKQQGATLSRLFQDGLLSGPEYDQAQRHLTAEPDAQRIARPRRMTA
jgi:hypothetical protein